MHQERLKLLIVEDEPDVRRSLDRILSLKGYTVLTAADGREGYSLFRDERPHIVLTDVYMPGMNGVELLSLVKKNSPQTPVVVMTGFGSEELAIRAIRNGASNYLKKPVHPSDIEYTVAVLAELVLSTGAQSFAPDRIMRESKTIAIGNEFDAIYPVINELTRTPSAFASDVEAIRIGLLEMITNAIEHGNLNISYEEKQAALRENVLEDLYRERAHLAGNRHKEVLISYEFTPRRTTYTICDQGAGFNWRNLPEPEDSQFLFEASGRGIHITMLCMDEVNYNDRGNEVQIVKRLAGND